MNIKETFLELTSRTYPYGNEHRLRDLLPKGTAKDNHGNYFYKIGNSRTIFACHLDTACKKYEKVNHVIDGNIIRTNGKTILGADDKAGVTVLLYMIEQKVPGTYYFFIGEEVGCIGSKAASAKDNFSKYDRIISFDRRDTCSVITHQGWERCCSNEFANELSKAYIDLGLELKPDDTGVHTDSAEFTSVIPECTNISVGYYKEHTHEEHQDIEFLEKLCMASAIIDWEKLPTIRNPKVKEYKEYNYGHNWNNSREKAIGWNWNDYDYDYGYYHDEFSNRKKSNFKKAYGYYRDDDEAPFDRAVDLDLRNRNKKNKDNKKINLKELTIVPKTGVDMFLIYKDKLNTQFTVEEYGIVEEQFINYL